MLENTPRCRLCSHSLKASPGCDICLPVKANLVWPVFENSHEFSAQSVIRDTLRMIKRRVSKLKTATKAEDAYDSRLTRDMVSLGRTLKELAAEQRKLEQRDSDDFEKLGFEGRCELFVNEFFGLLPDEFQIKLLHRMKDVFDTQRQPLLESTEHE